MMFVLVITCAIMSFMVLNIWCATMDTLTEVKRSLVHVRHALDRVAYYDEDEFSREFEDSHSNSSIHGQLTTD
jgi:hypothetical protein